MTTPGLTVAGRLMVAAASGAARAAGRLGATSADAVESAKATTTDCIFLPAMSWLREGRCDVAAAVSVSALSFFLRRRARLRRYCAAGVLAVQSWPCPVNCACNAPARTIATSEDAMSRYRAVAASRSRGVSVSSSPHLFGTALQTLLCYKLLQVRSKDRLFDANCYHTSTCAQM